MFHKTRRYFDVVGIRGLLKLTGAKLTHSTAVVELVRKDCHFPFRLRVPSSDVPTYRQIFINKDYDFLVQHEPEVIIDAGANIGLASIYFANKYPNAKIIAIEPEKSNFAILMRNVAPYSNVTPLQAALWNKSEQIQVTDPGHGKWAFRTEECTSGSAKSNLALHMVAGMTVNDIMGKFHIHDVDILKIDIEGAEKEVFSDTSTWIDKVDSIIIELHECMRSGCSRSFYCGSNGFKNEWCQGENVYLSKGNCVMQTPRLR
jgi:FkbM family methyltransferase